MNHYGGSTQRVGKAPSLLRDLATANLRQLLVSFSAYLTQSRLVILPIVMPMDKASTVMVSARKYAGTGCSLWYGVVLAVGRGYISAAIAPLTHRMSQTWRASLWHLSLIHI